MMQLCSICTSRLRVCPLRPIGSLCVCEFKWPLDDVMMPSETMAHTHCLSPMIMAPNRCQTRHIIAKLDWSLEQTKADPNWRALQFLFCLTSFYSLSLYDDDDDRFSICFAVEHNQNRPLSIIDYLHSPARFQHRPNDALTISQYMFHTKCIASLRYNSFRSGCKIVCPLAS